MVMKAGVRKLALTTHVTSSVGWLGSAAAFLALAVAGLSSAESEMVRAAYVGMHLTTWYVIVPFALASFLTGLLELAVLRDRREALRVARELQQMRGKKGLFAYELGVIHTALGDEEQAFSWLTLAVQERSGWIAYLRVDPRLEHLHADPRFTQLIPTT